MGSPGLQWRHLYYADNASATSFHDFYSPELNLSVITVRGTYSFWDVLSDINLFYEVAAIQLASTVLPITSILPDSIVAWIIQVGPLHTGLLRTPRECLNLSRILGREGIGRGERRAAHGSSQN